MKLDWAQIGLLVLAAASLGAGPATQGDARREELGRWLGQLADPDDAVRSAARAELMGIPRSELELFRQVVEANRPLRPSQAAPLREIVIQVYLAGEAFPEAEGFPFLGIRMVPTALSAAADGQPRMGVVVASRVPGFVGYRMFLDGDVVLRLLEPQTIEIRTPENVMDLVKDQHVGGKLTFEVLRHGQIIQVPLKLDARPADLLQIEAFQFARQEKAQDYWKRAFAPLLNEKVS